MGVALMGCRCTLMGFALMGSDVVPGVLMDMSWSSVKCGHVMVPGVLMDMSWCPVSFWRGHDARCPYGHVLVPKLVHCCVLPLWAVIFSSMAQDHVPGSQAGEHISWYERM